MPVERADPDDLLADRIAERSLALVVLLRLHRLGHISTATALEVVERSLRENES